MTRPSVAAVWRPRRTLLVLFLNGVVVYALILLRLHTVSEGLEEQSRQAFPGAGVDAVVLVQRQEEQSIRSLDKGQDKVRIIPPEPIDRESHSEKLNVLTGREERIEVANTRIFHLAWKADLKDPKQLGLEFKDDHGDGRPAYHEIVDEAGNVTRNVADLLQFAVVGFGKCGTTTLMDWISEHPRCKCFPEEILDLMRSDPAALLAKLYTLPSGDFQRGYKSPLDLTMPHIPRQISQLFPETKLIVGLRHPIRWFESLYNFRLQNWNPAKHPNPFPPIHALIGKCRGGTYNTCTAKGEFAVYLRNLGVTPTASSSQGPLDPSLGEKTRNLVHFERLLFKVADFKYESVAPLPNPVFLFEINQLHEENATRKQAFQHDVSDFLGLPADQPLSLDLPHSKPGKSWPASLQAEKDAAKIDICEDQYVAIRRVLLRQARTTAAWLRRVLLPTGRVQVSDPEHFDRLLDQWMVDPCGPHESVNSAGKKILALLDLHVKDHFVVDHVKAV